ncbi:hypothetical protein PG997_009328 [Apiospora hydei]|uniref:Uncharacterized protein n=1 Tax=Apiospora hydei TaxID=1337664 RepID=A0ABR1VTT1_9PEZI
MARPLCQHRELVNGPSSAIYPKQKQNGKCCEPDMTTLLPGDVRLGVPSCRDPRSTWHIGIFRIAKDKDFTIRFPLMHPLAQFSSASREPACMDQSNLQSPRAPAIYLDADATGYLGIQLYIHD